MYGLEFSASSHLAFLLKVRFSVVPPTQGLRLHRIEAGWTAVDTGSINTSRWSQHYSEFFMTLHSHVGSSCKSCRKCEEVHMEALREDRLPRQVQERDMELWRPHPNAIHRLSITSKLLTQP